MKAVFGIVLVFAGLTVGYMVVTGKLGNATTGETFKPTGPSPGSKPGTGGGVIFPKVQQRYYPGAQIYFG